jgi:RimJ/RimL family protein N-acetyltransferase
MKEKLVRAPASDIVFLRGKRVTLRPLSEKDAPLLTRWINDPDVRQYVLRYLPMTEKGELEWINSMSNSSNHNVTLGIVAKGTLIGSLGFHAVSQRDRYAEVGICIGDNSNREKGCGSDATMTLLEYGFNTLNLRKITWKAKAFNERSIACAKRCGFVEEARLREHLFVNGAYDDEVILSQFSADWGAKWQAYQKK